MTAPLGRFWSLATLRLPLSPLASMVRSSHAKPGAAMTGRTKLRSDRQAFGNFREKTSDLQPIVLSGFGVVKLG